MMHFNHLSYIIKWKLNYISLYLNIKKYIYYYIYKYINVEYLYLTL